MNYREQDGPSSQWQTVWQQHSGWLKTVLVARLRDGLVAEELLQEVAVLAWKKRDQLADQEKMGPWLYRIAIRQIQMFWRKQASDANRNRSLDQTSDHDLRQDQTQLNPLDWLTAQEVHAQVRVAMNQMSSQDREILMLKHTEDWTYEQIASQLGVSLDKVVYRLSRARKRLRVRLASLEREWANK